jgi:hypothetical protein
MKRFLFEYWFRGAWYSIVIEADSIAEATLRMMAIKDSAELKGEVFATVKVPSFINRLFSGGRP